MRKFLVIMLNLALPTAFHVTGCCKPLRLMKNTFLFLTLILAATSYAQQDFIDSRIVTTDNDTLYSKIRVSTNIFDRKLITESSFYRKVTLVDENHKKTQQIKAKNIRQLRFTDLKGEKRLYVNDKSQLQRLMFKGKLTWYRRISVNPMDGTVNYFDYLIDTDGKTYNMGLLNNKKKNLMEAVSSRPDLVKELEDTKAADVDVLAILRRYETE